MHYLNGFYERLNLFSNMKWLVVLTVFAVHYHANGDQAVLSRQKRIVGGYISPRGLFPFIASLRAAKYGPSTHFCGGAIITERFIVSSAHCMLLQEYTDFRCYKAKYVSSEDMKMKLTAVLGTNTLDENGDVYEIESFIYHSDFSFKLGLNDVSLLRTNRRIEFNNYVSPIALFDGEVPVGSTVIVPGWGLTSFPGQPSNNLRYIDLKTIGYDDCARAWKKVFRSQICTFTEIGEGVCTSDSGGPLVYNGDLIGLVSFGKPCADGFPDVFTNVTHVSKWIIFNSKCLANQLPADG